MKSRRRIDDPGKLNGNRKRKCRDISIATWNILSLYHTGACPNLTEILRKYNVSIAALQEIRWMGTEQIRIGEYINYYKEMESRHHFGAGFAIHKDYESRVAEFNPISERFS